MSRLPMGWGRGEQPGVGLRRGAFPQRGSLAEDVSAEAEGEGGTTWRDSRFQHAEPKRSEEGRP